MNEIPTPPRPRRWLRWLKRLGWCALWLVTLVALFVVVENWRGRRAWEKYVAEAKAAGEHLEPSAILPPPVPDAENFAAIPLFHPLFDFTNDVVMGAKGWRDPAARDRVQNLKPLHTNPAAHAASWRHGKFTDLAALQARYRGDTNFPARAQPGRPAEDVLVALGRFDAELNELRAAAGRPHSRFPINYEDNFSALLPHLQALRNFAGIAQHRALAELSLGQIVAAHDDVRLALRLAESVETEPLLISLLMWLSVLETAMPPLWEGLARHEWNDAQLAAFEARLARVNLAASLQSGLRGERLLMFGALDHFKKQPGLFDTTSLEDGSAVLGWMPTGWFDQNKVVMGRMYAQLVETAEPDARRFKPERALAVEQQLMALKPRWWLHPHTILTTLLMPALTKATERTAATQATVDLARVAIALERHRLKHGALPTSLDALDASVKPAGGLPRDVITGEALHYAPSADGKFKLYSTGWNGMDDGGTTVWTDAKQTRVDFTKGDWVWPMPEK